MANDKYIINDYSLEHVRNRYETTVIQIMRDRLLDEQDFCGCNLCLEDVYALAMNTLPAHYVQASAILLSRDPPTEADIARSVEDAFDTVRVRPNHT